MRARMYGRAAMALAMSLGLSAAALAGNADLHLLRAADHATPANAKKISRRGFSSLKVRKVGGQDVVYASVILEAKPAAVPALLRLGARVHSVLSNGIITADIPVKKIRAIAARADIGRMEASKRVRMYNDLSNGLQTGTRTDGKTWTSGMNNPRASNGAGVIVGVLDSGLDWTHGDFIDDATGKSRIRYYWDQSDHADGNPPMDAGFSYGHEYTKADFDAALSPPFDAAWDKNSPNTWPAVNDPSYPINAAARDTDGHGTHVTGSMAGDGSASGHRGVAYGAEIVFVKFDFEGDRNTDASIIDGCNYIFQRAAALGKPAVINMSLGSDFGPHDGSTLEERGLDGLTGPGKVIVVAAGNPGANNWSPALAWGFAMHGAGTMGTDPIEFRFPTYASEVDSYVFFDLWYSGNETCRVRVTSPSGQVYPPSFKGRYKNRWKTGSAYQGFNTAEGAILVGNGGDQLGWDTNNNDHEIYIEISNYYGTDPATGTWKIEIIPLSTPAGGGYHSWHGVSSNLVRGYQAETTRSPTPTFGGRESDNAYTIGSPASASKVIAVAANTSRMSWTYYDPIADASSAPTTQSYGQAPLDYYDPMQVGELATFSGRGPRRDGVLKPEIAAPGVGIASAFSHFTRHLEWPDRKTAWASGGPYHFATNRVLPNLEGGILQGTSMASPNAAGAVTLLVEADSTLDAAGLRDLFATTARHDDQTDTFELTPFVATPFTDTDDSAAPGTENADWGYGKLDIDAGLAFINQPQPNRAPLANAGADQTRSDTDGNGSESVTLDGSGSSDPDGDTLTYVWKNGAGATISNGSSAQATVLVGTEIFTLTVSDGELTSTDAVSITVQAPSAGDTVTITKATYSSRKQKLTVEATSTGAPSATLTADWGTGTGVLSYNAKKGKYSLKATGVTSKPATVTVTSDQGGSDTASVGGK